MRTRVFYTLTRTAKSPRLSKLELIERGKTRSDLPSAMSWESLISGTVSDHAATGDETDQGEDQSDDEQDPGNVGGGAHHSGESEDAGDESDDEEGNG